ncbi:craniofacial development protein 1 [Ambystoma mexicanum]|uniref:craniofacial development protein 1 n=1 Tax=Ambystoma mexicanum TaxID=8296 RepID=UPI0037E808E8
MSDSEDYSSSEDEDYVPSGEEYSEDDVNDLVPEEAPEEEEGTPQPTTGKRKSAKGIVSRKRKKGGLRLDPGDAGTDGDAAAPDFAEEKVVMVEEVKKKKADDLWASFLSDVGQKPKAALPANTQKEQSHASPKAAPPPQASPISAKPTDAPKVTITKVFDFAGEEVRVTKEVAATSKEAQTYLKQQEEGSARPAPAVPPASSGIKRPAGVSSILGKIGSKKQKMSTLEKSKLDWDTFKEQEGIGDELAIHNRGKEGYIERKAFLDRVDHRQFELERDVRIKNMKK